MKKISINDFMAFLSKSGWKHEDEYEITHCLDDNFKKSGIPDNELSKIPMSTGFVSRVSRLDDVFIKCEQYFEKNQSGEIMVDENEILHSFKGIQVIDESGDCLTTVEMSEYLNADFTMIHHDQIEYILSNNMEH